MRTKHPTYKLCFNFFINFAELPWDEPTIGCGDFVKWKSDNTWMTITPWSKLETLALSLLRKLLDTDAKKRITVKQIIEHKWCNFKRSGMRPSLNIYFSFAAPNKISGQKNSWIHEGGSVFMRFALSGTEWLSVDLWIWEYSSDWYSEFLHALDSHDPRLFWNIRDTLATTHNAKLFHMKAFACFVL